MLTPLNSDALIAATAEYVREQLSADSSGHDWWHVYRVWRLSCTIADSEDVDRPIVELAALMHDIADWKFHEGDELVGGAVARRWLTEQGAPGDLVERVVEIIDHVSFRGAGVPDQMGSPEGRVVQDADRLDAMGAVGVARVFAFGGHAGRSMYDPSERPELHATATAYKQSESSSITHFYEKLLLLRDRMHTETARRIAEDRHQFMEQFLERFYLEWDGKR